MDQGISSTSNYEEMKIVATSDNIPLNIPSQEAVVSEIVEYYQAKISKDMRDMVGHVINTIDAQNLHETHRLQTDLQKYKCIIKIQQVLMKLKCG